MKKMKSIFRLNLIVVIVIINFQCLNAQVIDASSALKDLSTITVKKNKMFPVDEVIEHPRNDTIIVEPPSKVSSDNPGAYTYRLDPMQVKAVFPEIVFTVDDNLLIDYYSLFPILFELINNQQKQIDELKIQIEELKK